MTSHDSTHALLRRSQAGDRQAFDSLMANLRARLVALIRLRLGSPLRNRVEVDDIVQETHLRAFKSILDVTCENEDEFFRWLAAVAEHVIVDSARRHKRRPVVPLGQELPADHMSASEGLRRDERFDRLQIALDSLSEDHREVIVLARIHGLPLRDVAARMERSYAAVAQLLARALRELRSSFGDTESLSLPERRLETGSGGDGDA